MSAMHVCIATTVLQYKLKYNAQYSDVVDIQCMAQPVRCIEYSSMERTKVKEIWGGGRGGGCR